MCGESLMRRGFSRLKDPLLLICVSQFCIAMGENLIEPILPLFAMSFNISYAIVGLVVSSFGFTRVVGEIPGGILTDRIGRKPLILLGYVLSSASHVIGGFSQSYIELMVSRMILGMGSAIQLTASLTYIGDITSTRERGKHVALFQSTYSIAGIIGPTLGGIISSFFNMRSIFFFSTLISAIGVLLVLFISDRNEETKSFRAFPKASNIIALVKNFKILALCASCFVMFFIITSIRGTLIPLYGVQELGLDPYQIGLILSIFSVTNLLNLLFIGHRFERLIKRSLLLTLSLLTCAVSLYLLSFSSDLFNFALLSAPLGFGLGLLQPVPFALLLDYTNPSNIGLAMGVLRTIGDLGIVFGPIMVGRLMDIGQTIWVFYISAFFIGLLSVITWFVFHSENKHLTV